MEEKIKKILDISVSAPSGDNVQPWKFKINSPDSISLHNLPNRDSSLYNSAKRAAFTAHGTLIENISIAASNYGLGVDIDYFPDMKDSDHVANIRFRASDEQSVHPLFDSLSIRSTNRKPYERTSLSAEQMSSLQLAANGQEGLYIRAIEDTDRISQSAHAVAQNEAVLFSNSFLHRFFYAHIHWTDESAQKARTGFPAKTLEIPAPILPVFRLFGNWHILQHLQKINIHKAIAANNKKTYSSCGAMVAILSDDIQPKTYLQMGRVFERMWLISQKNGLSFQPLMGIVFLQAKIESSDLTGLSDDHIKIIRESYNILERQFGAQNKKILAICRIGRSRSPSGKTYRLNPEISS